MWPFTKKTVIVNAPIAMPSVDFEELSKRITSLHAEVQEQKSALYALDAKFLKLQGTLYAKLYPQKNEKEEPKEPESKDSNTFHPPFF